MHTVLTYLRLGFFCIGTLALAPLQWLLQRFGLKQAFFLPLWFHRVALMALGVRVHVDGVPMAPGPILLVANHGSWLDIPVIGSVAPVVFVAKSEVADWPIFGWLAKLQYTIFVNRQRRTASKSDGNAIADRLKLGDRAVLFAEGTSNDGNRVLSFKSSLVGAVLAGGEDPIAIQPLAIIYEKQAGLPITRAERPHIYWYGDMVLAPHLMEVFRAATIDVRLVFGPIIDVEAIGGRKPATAAANDFVASAVALVRNGLPLPSYSNFGPDRVSTHQVAPANTIISQASGNSSDD